MAEGHIEIAPRLGHRAGRFEVERAATGQAPSIFDGAGSRVVPEPLGDAALVGEETEEATAVATGVEDAPAVEVHVDRVEHGPPDEAMLVLHRFVIGRAAPVTRLHSPVRLPACVRARTVSSQRGAKQHRSQRLAARVSG